MRSRSVNFLTNRTATCRPSLRHDSSIADSERLRHVRRQDGAINSIDDFPGTLSSLRASKEHMRRRDTQNVVSESRIQELFETCRMRIDIIRDEPTDSGFLGPQLSSGTSASAAKGQGRTLLADEHVPVARAG